MREGRMRHNGRREGQKKEDERGRHRRREGMGEEGRARSPKNHVLM